MFDIPTIEEKKSIEKDLLKILENANSDLSPKELIENFHKKYHDTEDDYSLRSLIWHLIDIGLVSLTIDRNLRINR